MYGSNSDKRTLFIGVNGIEGRLSIPLRGFLAAAAGSVMIPYRVEIRYMRMEINSNEPDFKDISSNKILCIIM